MAPAFAYGVGGVDAGKQRGQDAHSRSVDPMNTKWTRKDVDDGRSDQPAWR